VYFSLRVITDTDCVCFSYTDSVVMVVEFVLSCVAQLSLCLNKFVEKKLTVVSVCVCSLFSIVFSKSKSRKKTLHTRVLKMRVTYISTPTRKNVTALPCEIENAFFTQYRCSVLCTEQSKL